MKVLHVIEQNCTIHKRFQHIVVKNKGHKLQSFPLKRLETVVVYGHNQLSTQVIHQLLNEGITIIYVSLAGTIQGIMTGKGTNNVILRMAQYEAFKDDDIRLYIARKIIQKKLLKQEKLISDYRRYLSEREADKVMNFFKEEQIKLKKAGSIGSIQGIEGASAKAYFGCFDKLLKHHGFEQRERRPAYDIVNALLNLSYMTLLRQTMLALTSKGFDSEIAFIHGLRYGRDSLALDLMEPYRPDMDRLVLTLLNTKRIQDGDYEVSQEEGCRLTEDGLKSYVSYFNQDFGDKGKKLYLQGDLDQLVNSISRYLLKKEKYLSF